VQSADATVPNCPCNIRRRPNNTLQNHDLPTASRPATPSTSAPARPASHSQCALPVQPIDPVKHPKHPNPIVSEPRISRSAAGYPPSRVPPASVSSPPLRIQAIASVNPKSCWPLKTAFQLLYKAAQDIRPHSTRRAKGLSFHEFVAYHGMRLYQGYLTPVQIQNLLPSTEKTCGRFARKHGLVHRVIELDYGGVVHQLGGDVTGLSTSDPVRHVVLFHGGGYMAPALGRHLELAIGFADRPRGDVVVHMLQYGMFSLAIAYASEPFFYMVLSRAAMPS
ncbi:hypothetical protein E4U30_000525, partial [Claviceps sp. LM220 group G6]